MQLLTNKQVGLSLLLYRLYPYHPILHNRKNFWSALLEKNSQSGNISKTDWAGGWACCAQSHSSIHAWDNHIRAPLYPSHWSLSTTTVILQQLHIFIRRLGDRYPLQYSPEWSPLSLGQNLHISNAIWGEKVKGRSKVIFFFKHKVSSFQTLEKSPSVESLNFCTDL